ncbi:zinc-ribbon domain-containing protein [Thermoplasmatales archaeon SCGC AB-540-F20]|nr:zinc-ribbon domain-containing protein [Thermoplasmatales archaeon SCGC AB-540-F20]
MSVIRNLGGNLLYILGIFIIIFGFFTAIFSTVACGILFFIGIIFLILGKYYAGTEVVYPTQVLVEDKRNDRRCPNCGRIIPFDAIICPYCSKKFEDY